MLLFDEIILPFKKDSLLLCGNIYTLWNEKMCQNSQNGNEAIIECPFW